MRNVSCIFKQHLVKQHSLNSHNAGANEKESYLPGGVENSIEVPSSNTKLLSDLDKLLVKLPQAPESLPIIQG